MRARDLIEPAAVAVALLAAVAAVWLVRVEPGGEVPVEPPVAAEPPVLPWAPEEAPEHTPPDPGSPRAPLFSPDGRYLAFERVHQRESSVWVARTDSPEPGERVLLRGSADAVDTRAAAWNPDRVLVFEGRFLSGFRRRLYVASAGGASGSELPGELAGDPRQPAADDRYVAFVAEDGVWTRDWSSGSETRVAECRTAATPSLSRRAVAFTCPSDGGLDVVVASLDGRAVHGPGPLPGDQQGPVWITDDALVFFSSEPGSQAVDLLRFDARGLTVLEVDVVVPRRGRPAVSPDGRWVAYGVPGDGETLWLAPTDGGALRAVRTGACDVADPDLAFRGDRALLAFVGRPCDGDRREVLVRDVTDAIR